MWTIGPRVDQVMDQEIESKVLPVRDMESEGRARPLRGLARSTNKNK